MFLKSLVISNDNGVIRNIIFQSGMNIIVDETSAKIATATGNNVGKTTVLRLIAYCLGKDKKTIYQDPEFSNKTDTKVEQFLKETNVIVRLTLKKDLNHIDIDDEIIIERNFLDKKQKLLIINGKSFNNTKKVDGKETEFSLHLKEKLFDFQGELPTYNQMLNKNIRIDERSLDNTVKVLHDSTSNAEYEPLYLYWLGLDVDKNKAEYEVKLKAEKRLFNRLTKEYSTQQELENLLSALNKKIDDLETEKSNFYVNENYEKDLRTFHELKNEIIASDGQRSFLEVRCKIINESIKELQTEDSHVNAKTIELLYKRANSLIPDIQKTFEESLLFQTQMRKEKANFLADELPELENSIRNLDDKLVKLKNSKNELERKLTDSNTQEALESLVVAINESYEQKGEYQSQIKTLSDTTSNIDKLKKSIESINKDIGAEDKHIQDNISRFNQYFSKISRQLYNEYFTLSAIKGGDGNYQLTINSVEGQKGTGRKKGEIAAFDLAYIAFSDKINRACLRFLLYDQLETVHGNQINNLSSMAEEINCQIIVPILKDKLPEDLPLSCHEVLTLSEDNKLFKF